MRSLAVSRTKTALKKILRKAAKNEKGKKKLEWIENFQSKNKTSTREKRGKLSILTFLQDANDWSIDSYLIF